MSELLGKKIQYHRKKKQYSLDKLAKLTESSKSYLWELENPRKSKKPLSPTIEKLTKIAKELSITTDYLLNDYLGENEEDLSNGRKDAFFRKYDKLGEDDQKRIDEMIDLWGQTK